MSEAVEAHERIRARVAAVPPMMPEVPEEPVADDGARLADVEAALADLEARVGMMEEREIEAALSDMDAPPELPEG